MRLIVQSEAPYVAKYVILNPGVEVVATEPCTVLGKYSESNMDAGENKVLRD